MGLDLKTLNGTWWLAEPKALRLGIERIARIPTCPTARELAAARAERLEVAKQAAARAPGPRKGKVGVIPIHGPVDQRMSPMLDKMGGTSCEEVGVALDALVAAPDVGTIVLHVDSPGGVSFGVEELSDKIFEARNKKRILAIADSMAASAGYWIASAAKELYVTPGGEVGSVGVYCVHVDESKAMEQEGLSVTLVSAGRYKTECAPFGPLSDEARAYLQESVNYTYGKFTGAVQRNRNVTATVVQRDFGQGRMVNAEEAVAARMADKVMTFEALMARLLGGSGSESPSAPRASVDALRRRQAHRKRDAERFSST